MWYCVWKATLTRIEKVSPITKTYSFMHVSWAWSFVCVAFYHFELPWWSETFKIPPTGAVMVCAALLAELYLSSWLQDETKDLRLEFINAQKNVDKTTFVTDDYKASVRTSVEEERVKLLLNLESIASRIRINIAIWAVIGTLVWGYGDQIWPYPHPSAELTFKAYGR